VSSEVLALVKEPMEMALGGEGMAFDFGVGDEPQTRRSIAASFVPHVEGQGHVLGFYAFAQDVTERVRTQEELHLQQDQIAHASRVLVLGELASALAHELNQPLTAVLSNAHAALRLHAAPRALRLEQEVDETLRDIAHGAARAGEIIAQMRDLVRKGASQKATLDVNEAVRGIEALIRATALENDVTVYVDLAPWLPLTIGDKIQIQQVVLNLVRNGIEAMASLLKSERRIVVRSTREGDSIAVSVEDSGPPIAKEVLDRLFLPFHTTKANGLGLGLAISRSIIQAHGGSIEAKAAAEGGLRVRFTVPVKAGVAEPGPG
jgi:C4-dicarboxylate-specific signal transduction histidine kinase